MGQEEHSSMDWTLLDFLTCSNNNNSKKCSLTLCNSKLSAGKKKMEPIWQRRLLIATLLNRVSEAAPPPPPKHTHTNNNIHTGFTEGFIPGRRHHRFTINIQHSFQRGRQYGTLKVSERSHRTPIIVINAVDIPERGIKRQSLSKSIQPPPH